MARGPLFAKFMFAAVAIIASLISMAMPAYGHGISTDVAPPIKFQDRDVTVFVKMTPAFITDSVSNASIEVTLKDVNTGEVIPHVTFFIKLDKQGKSLHSDHFHAHDGKLVLGVKPEEIDKTWISAYRETDLGWIASSDFPALAEGPIFLDGGLYHFAIDVMSLKEGKLFPDPALKYDAYVSIGESSAYSIDGEELQIRTMYDKIQNFSFDSTNNILKFSMPFTWDSSYLALVPLVHVEVQVPRSFSEFLADRYAGTVNGISVPDEAIMIDNSNPDFIVVHYMIMNRQLMQLSEQVTSTTKDANMAIFTLTPSTSKVGMLPTGQMMATSSDGSVMILLSWIPATIEPFTPTTFTLNFIDAETKQPMKNVPYDFVLIKDGNEILKRTGQQSTMDVGTEQFTFTESQTGSVTLRLDNIGNTNESVEFSINVVPEFPNVLTIMAGAVTVLLLLRFKKITGKLFVLKNGSV